MQNVTNMQDPREEKILILSHRLAELSLQPLRETRQEIGKLACQIQALAGGEIK
jgi:hypothetical protein